MSATNVFSPQVQLSHSPRLLRASDAHAAGDAEARAQRNKQRVVLQSRAITHPSFRNLPRDKVPAPPTSSCTSPLPFY